MGISVEKIRDSNNKFYYSNYFFRSKYERFFWISFSLIIVAFFQLFTFLVARRLIKQCYINQARFENLGTEEIYDWVNRQTGVLPKELLIIVIVTGIIIAYTIVLYHMDVINIHKYKRRCIIITIVIFFTEIIGIIFFNREILRNSISASILMALLCFLKFIFELLNTGIILPVEMKAPAVKMFTNIINRVIDEALKRL